MGSVKTDAIVLRHANYNENDRMLTLLSPTLGLLSVSARGCRKAASRNLPATELFTVGEYLLYQKADRNTLTSFQSHEGYYPLRLDVDKLAHGSYWLGLCEAAAQPGEECPRLFKMLLLSLAVLAYGELPPRMLTAVFLMQFSLLLGFAPRLDRCARCGGDLSPPLRFDPEAGGVACAACAGGRGEPLSPESLLWLREAQARGAFVLAGRQSPPREADPAAAELPFQLLRAHVEARLDKRIAPGKFL